ncbi:MAG: hypothetical protein IJK33_09870 [Clostridia bacterium]|nr:hypothetical protein [Clostridia bacterium]
MDSYYFGKPKASGYDYSKAVTVKAEKIKKEYVTELTDEYVYINADNEIFEIGGLLPPHLNHGEYYRLDASKRSEYHDGKDTLSDCTSGGTLRFYTDADRFVLKVKYRSCCLGMHHFCDRGVYGFDMYLGTGTDKTYCGAMMQTFADNPTENAQILKMPQGYKEVTVEFPLYGGIQTLDIGIPRGAHIAKPAPRTFKPVAFYGSSITQGGCVSRPGSMYSNIICRALDCDNINMGYSGSAFGEQYVAEWIGERDISAFVMDYDYNSRSVEELDATHEPFYETVRNAHPDIPILIVTHPCFWDVTENDRKKSRICRRTYDKMKKRGDNVYFIDGGRFFPAPMKDLFCVDNLHPNDLGHYYMAKAIYPVLARALKGNK